MAVRISREQLDALELWIISIVEDMKPHADLADGLDRNRKHERVIALLCPEDGKKGFSDGHD